MTIITFITFIITTYPTCLKQHTTQPTRFNAIPLTNPNNLIHRLVVVFFLRFGTGNWPLPPKDIFLQAKLNVGKWKSHDKKCLAIYYLKWYYVKRSDVLQYHMMAKDTYIMTFNMVQHVQQYVAMDM